MARAARSGSSRSRADGSTARGEEAGRRCGALDSRLRFRGSRLRNRARTVEPRARPRGSATSSIVARAHVVRRRSGWETWDSTSRGTTRDQAEQPHPRTAVIEGLAETGGRADEARILDLLEHDSATVRRAALSAARLLLAEDVLIYAASSALHDPSELVVRAAARVLRRRVPRVPTTVIDQAVRSANRATRLAGLRLARRTDGWSRLEAALLLITDGDPDVSREGHEDIGNWVRRVAPRLYSAPPEAQLETISSTPRPGRAASGNQPPHSIPLRLGRNRLALLPTRADESV